MNHCKCSEHQWPKQQIQNSGAYFMRIFFFYSFTIVDSWVSETCILHILTPINMLAIPKVCLNWDVPYGDADVQYSLCNFRKKAVQSQYKQHADKISNPPGFPYFQNLHDLSK